MNTIPRTAFSVMESRAAEVGRERAYDKEMVYFLRAQPSRVTGEGLEVGPYRCPIQNRPREALRHRS